MNEPTEPAGILDIFCTEVSVEDLGNNMRALVFSAPHRAGGELRHHETVRIITPAACLLDMRRKLAPHADQVLIDLITPLNTNNNSH